MAMILNGLGFSNRQLSLGPQDGENTPGEHLWAERSAPIGESVAGLGRTLDWLSAHDPTRLCAGIAHQARPVCGVSPTQIPVDPTSFPVHRGDVSNARPSAEGASTMQEAATDPAVIAIISGSSRDRREDLNPWMLALATTHDGDIPLCVQPLDGNSSETVRAVAAIQAMREHVRESDATPRVDGTNNGVSREATMRGWNQVQVTWVNRV